MRFAIAQGDKGTLGWPPCWPSGQASPEWPRLGHVQGLSWSLWNYLVFPAASPLSRPCTELTKSLSPGHSSGQTCHRHTVQGLQVTLAAGGLASGGLRGSSYNRALPTLKSICSPQSEWGSFFLSKGQISPSEVLCGKPHCSDMPQNKLIDHHQAPSLGYCSP